MILILRQKREGLCHVDAGAFGDNTLCLFDGTAAVERGLQLLGEFLRFACRLVLEDGDGRHIGEGLGGW